MDKIYRKYTLREMFCVFCDRQIANAYTKCKCNKGQLIKPYLDKDRFYCEKYNFWTIFTLINDSKIPTIHCEMIVRPFLTNENIYDVCDDIEKKEFEFTFTTNDSDVDIFEPYFDNLFRFSCSGQLDIRIEQFHYDNIVVYNPKRMQQNRKSKKKTKKNIINQEEFKEKLKNLKLTCENLIFSSLDGKNIRFKQKLARTLANVYVEIKIKKEQYIDEKKDCAHVSRKKKKIFPPVDL